MEHENKARLLTEHLRWGLPKRGPPPLILDNCWSAYHLNPNLVDAKLARFYTFDRRLTIHVAGKQVAPDVASFALASRILSELSKYIESVPLSLDKWRLSAVTFPYQKGRSLWYADVESDYGSILSYSFMSSTKDGDFSISDEHRGTYESVPGTIISALDWLRYYKVADQELVHIIERIESEKLFGTELISPLWKILERNSAQFDPPIWRWTKQRFDAIAELADQGSHGPSTKQSVC